MIARVLRRVLRIKPSFSCEACGRKLMVRGRLLPGVSFAVPDDPNDDLLCQSCAEARGIWES